MPDHPGVLERAAPVALERFERHVRGRGGEPALLERGPHVVRRLPEVARELDFPVPDGRDPVERPLEIALQRAAHGVELEADVVERRGRARQPAHARAVQARRECRVAPQLATRWQLRSPNTWRFHLRQGVRMHDGTTLTAAAVVWTMRRIARAGGGPMGIGQSSARVIDDTTLDITPTRRGRRLIEQLANPDWSIMAPGSDSTARPVGTGPFRLVEYARGDHLTVERFDQYWGDRARLRRLTFRFLADANARLLALHAGDVQVASDLPREAAPAARMLPDIAVATSPVGGYEALYVTEQSAAIRRAIIYALDRPRLVEAAWRGTAEPAQLLGPAVPLGPSADLVARARPDPPRART